MIHIYCGDGKGKTTAAFGLAARASMSGYRVTISQFLKAKPSGEVKAFEALPNITVLSANIPNVFSWQMTEEQRMRAKAAHNDLFAQAVQCCHAGEKTMLVFDELLGAFSTELIDSRAVMKFLREKKQDENVEIVITGRGPSQELMELADYVTEMKKIKHPFDDGVKMRQGIEY